MRGDVRSAQARRALAGNEVLGALEPAEAEALVARGRVARYEAAEAIFRQGDPGDSMMIVLSGRVRISNTVPGGKEAIINFIDPGRLFGEIALLDGKPRSADATADVRSELLVLHRRELIPFLQAHPAVTIRLVALLCERLRRATAMMEDVMFLNTGQRIAKA